MTWTICHTTCYFFISIDDSKCMLQHNVDLVVTPFVNRRREVVELALRNAHFILTIRGCITKGNMITSWRSHRFVFAQMYGAGKTRIGCEFLKQVQVLLKDKNKAAFHQFCPVELKLDIEDLLEIVSEFPSAAREYFDLSNYQNFATDCRSTADFSEYILGKCKEKMCSVFFHFDEVGTFDVTNLRLLRDCCFRALKKLKDVHLYPLFFFQGVELHTMNWAALAHQWLGAIGSFWNL